MRKQYIQKFQNKLQQKNLTNRKNLLKQKNR